MATKIKQISKEGRDFGKKLQNARGKMPTESLAKLAGVGKKQIERYERGEAEPSFTTIHLISKALEVDVFSLLSEVFGLAALSDTRPESFLRDPRDQELIDAYKKIIADLELKIKEKGTIESLGAKIDELLKIASIVPAKQGRRSEHKDPDEEVSVSGSK